MGKGLPRSLKHADQNVVRIMQVDIDHTISVTGDSGAANDGQVVIGDFPEGNVLFLGAVANVQFTGPTSDELSDTWEGDYAIGTTADANSVLSGTDANIIASTALAAATAEVSPKTRGQTGTDSTDGGLLVDIFDNTDGSLELNLNLLIDDAELTDSETIDVTATGELYIAYAILGDD